MEFISLGGLLPGLSTEDIRIGVSQPRNKKLAEIFHRLRLIESYRARGSQRYAVTVKEPGVEWASKNMLVLGWISIELFREKLQGVFRDVSYCLSKGSSRTKRIMLLYKNSDLYFRDGTSREDCRYGKTDD